MNTKTTSIPEGKSSVRILWLENPQDAMSYDGPSVKEIQDGEV